MELRAMACDTPAMTATEFERWYPATPDETFEALRLFVYRTHGIKSKDDFALAVTFETRSAFTSGQHVSAAVMPRDGGSVVVVRGTGKIRTQMGNANSLNKAADELLAGVSAVIQENRKAQQV